MYSHTLKPVQQDIISYLYRFRFLTSIQISQLLKQSLRFTNYHLKVLSVKNYIGKHYSRTLGLSNRPAIYYLASESIKVVSEKPGFDKRTLKRIYKEKIRSQQFIDHSAYVAEYFLFLRKDSEKSGKTLHFFTKTDLSAHTYLIHPLPDAYIARTDKVGQTKRYFLEIVEDSSPRFALRKRVEQYCDYLDGGEFTQVTGHDFPILLFICPGIASLIYLRKHIARIYEETSLDQTEVYVATKEGAIAGRWELVATEDE